MTDEDLRQRLEKLDTDLRSFKEDTHKRFISLEQKLTDSEKVEAIATVRRDELTQRFERLENSFEKLSNNINWLVKLIIGGLVLAIVSFVVGGGIAI